MQIGVNVVNRGAMATSETMVRFAQRAEALGLNSVTVSDHVVIPRDVPDNYPYHPQGEFHWEQARDYYEPFTVMAFLAGATSKIRLGTSVMIISYRNPLIVAKMLSSLDALSGGRIFLGVGTGWWEDEYKALGIPGHFKERGPRTDEYIRIFRELWQNEDPSFSGQFYSFGNLEFSPKPAQKSGIPIWIGGHTRRALRRTAELGDAWHPIGLRPPAGLTPEELAAKREELAELTRAAGRDPATIPVCFRAPLVFADQPDGLLSGPPDKIVEDAQAYGQAGADHITFDLMADDATQLLERLERLGTEILPKLR